MSGLTWKCRFCHKPSVHRGMCEEHLKRPVYRPVTERTGKSKGKRKRPIHDGDKRWNQLRKVFLSRNPLCASCLKQGRFVPASIVDHILPVRYYPELLYDESNLQALCTNKPFSCHQRKTAQEFHGIAVDFIRGKRRDFTRRMIGK